MTVIDGEAAGPLADAEVVVADGRFSAIRPATGPRPAGGPVLDARGGYLVPGLWESHTHLGGFASAKPEHERAAYVSQLLTDFLSAGVTTVVDLGGPLDIELAARDYRGKATDPAAGLFFAGPVFTGVRGWPVLDDPARAPIAHQVDDAGVAHRQALELADQVDFIKCIYDGEPGAPDKLPLDALKAIVAAAHEKGKKVLVHVHERLDLEEAVAAGADGIEHAFQPQDPTSDAEARDVAALLAGTGTYYCPTLVTWEQLAHNGEAGYLRKLVDGGFAKPEDLPAITSRPLYGHEFPRHSARDSHIRFDYAMRTLALMHDAGVKITAGSDVAMLLPSPPVALLRELHLLAEAGLPLPAVLAAGTRHSAEKIGPQATAPGTITAGAVADALLLDADPYADITHLTDRAHHIGTLRAGRASWGQPAA
ncbi:amidohydrolase family protein [Amycolatopsis saalfeldensis]|uniref:amidohydrolase family protein n=1 Tax=Amycolatopsis saalfeldensis TaxID=394193 RepID=UPI0015A5CAB9|nr:amidohydrolase family protein [Amycolatopsis saalfeldensis]